MMIIKCQEEASKAKKTKWGLRLDNCLFATQVLPNLLRKKILKDDVSTTMLPGLRYNRIRFI